MTFLSLIDIVGSGFVVLVLDVEKCGIEKESNCWEDNGERLFINVLHT